VWENIYITYKGRGDGAVMTLFCKQRGNGAVMALSRKVSSPPHPDPLPPRGEGTMLPGERKRCCQVPLTLTLSRQGRGKLWVQTGNIVYKTDRIHGLHFTARRRTDAVEGAKPDGIKNATC